MQAFSENHFELDLPEMEAQHKYLFQLFDMIEHGQTVSDEKAMSALLAEIERYVLFHLASEEYLMRAYRFKGYAAHQTDHENASAKLVAFLDDFEAKRLNPARLRVFLTGWLMEHSELSDSQYVQWILEQRKTLRAQTNPRTD